MRIIAGMAKGCTLKSLRGRVLRPTMDRVRETIFAVLAQKVVGAKVLDLFAGAGTVGLEALSRGATEAVFIESHRPAGEIIKENAARCGVAEQAVIILAPVPRGLAIVRQQKRQFRIIFLDPPYDQGEVGATLARLGQWPNLLEETGVLVVQRSRHEEIAEQIGPFKRMKQSRFGETIVDYYQMGGPIE